ncbi:TonB family protein [Novosphingobium album (ex Liu et al. 2023)]|uniref:TonB family protein n=1 Tax=Novosphingobium album (ex Liu et al. 2023) TaxID=3031130 RepID=A0ABT5WRT7_9SPHN|nr:TonB family protein [Novosphingobium album (ex Liu et al. 2023)]MDE8652710.1 TonB family protein [Novosphingobium album (ex Liu et al. 2023)]
MSQADLTPPRRVRLAVGLLVVLLHLLAIGALVRAFAPDFSASVVAGLGHALTVTITTPEPPPEPTPTPEPRPQASTARPQGAAAPAAPKAVPKEAAAPRPRITLASPAAPPVAAKGAADAAGAGEAGAGTGAGGAGQGTGAGAGGTGQGGGAAARAVKLSGEINSARDYPRESRDLRIGDYVVVALTVGKDGRVRDCRVHRPSRDPEADRITCRLASERFRFRPATDASGQPVESVYGWQQRWFYPGRD